MGTSLYFHTKVDHVEDPDSQSINNLSKTNENLKRKQTTFSTRNAINLVWSHFKDSYTDPIVIQWSLWWALALCGFTQVMIFFLSLFMAPSSLTIKIKGSNVYTIFVATN